MKIEIQVEEICTFHHHAQWVNHASSWIGGFRKEEKIICIDKNGNTLTIGMDFRVAKEKDLFPVKAYRCIRTSEVSTPSKQKCMCGKDHIMHEELDNVCDKCERELS